MTRQIVLLAARGAQVLDATGPAAVFSAANDGRAERGGSPPSYQVILASPAGGAVETISSVTLQTAALADVDPAGVHTCLVAGHDRDGMQALIADRGARDWVLQAAAQAPRWGSVCSGAFALAAWGLLDGRRAATHWGVTEEMARGYPKVAVDADSLYVTDGPVWTSAGITAGIDMSLAMVEADLGARIAATIARRLVVYLRRPGSQAQFSDALKRQCAAATPYAELIDWAEANLATDLNVERLAERAGQSLRTFQRRFAAATGRSPAAFVEDLRIDRAKMLIASGVALKVVAGDVGYPDAGRLSTAFRRRMGLSPSVWRAMHGNDPDHSAIRPAATN
ncbi:GlxA family transcriptional regulator [Marinibaculum pumilum]|uniref:GlxA family transcriptional regulator n=1 Tax=Marinibaculum pumilum TaxID=1766165 RepID=A0ABV7KZI9_9PROT